MDHRRRLCGDCTSRNHLVFRANTSHAPEIRVDIVTPPTNAPGAFALSPDGLLMNWKQLVK